ncbi:PASTA domain-containing protein [Actinophytocola glycyrrhizae]|uniref:PASTA domain-containing protein n=1 Tax=Actinophytocola glycyrrhizae TaxID=2044873 RepID=A0ABV9S5W0_9PSEU
MLFLLPGGTVSAAPAPANGPSWQEASPSSTGIVPDVTGWDVSSAVAAVQAAGFVARTSPGFVDCGPPYVQLQNPGGGASAVLGSTVTLRVNRQPGPGQPCP